MRGDQWIASLIPRPAPEAPVDVSWQDVLGAFRGAYGKGATRVLAGYMGVDIRTAQRYYTGRHAPHRHGPAGRGEELRAELERTERQRQADREAQAMTGRRRAIADKLRRIRELDPGRVVVRSRSTPGERPTTRRIRTVDRVDDGLAKVADLWEAGAYKRAADALSDTIIARYNGEGSGRSDGLAGVIAIVDYPQGIAYRE